VPDDLVQVVQHQLRSSCERLVWTLDPDVLSHAGRLLCLLIILSRLILIVLLKLAVLKSHTHIHECNQIDDVNTVYTVINKALALELPYVSGMSTYRLNGLGKGHEPTLYWSTTASFPLPFAS